MLTVKKTKVYKVQEKDMPFTKEPIRTPTSIGIVQVEITDNPADPGIVYRVQIKYSDGKTEIRTGDLIPVLSAAQLTQLQNFMATLRTKATTEFIG